VRAIWRATRDSRGPAWRHALQGGRVGFPRTALDEQTEEDFRESISVQAPETHIETSRLPAPWELRTTRGWGVEASGWSGLAGPLRPSKPGGET
jgi:hypothetical protein